MLVKKISCLILLLPFFHQGISYAQQGISPQLKEPIQKAIQNNSDIKNSYLENQKTLLDQNTVSGKLLPHVTAMGMYGYLHGTGELDLPTKTLPLLGLNLLKVLRNSMPHLR